MERAARAYKDINLLGFKLLRPGGVLVSFSCSGAVGPELFQEILAGAALDAGVAARAEQRLMAAPDHPVSLSFPEGEYMKGLVCRARRYRLRNTRDPSRGKAPGKGAAGAA